MQPEVTISIGVFLGVVGVMSAQPMFSILNRPNLFRGKWGEIFFFVVTSAVWFFGLSLVVWSFTKVTWYINIPLLIGAFILSGVIIYPLLPGFLRATAVGPIFSGIGLAVLHNWTWFSK